MGNCGRVTRWHFLNQSDAVGRKVLLSELSRASLIYAGGSTVTIRDSFESVHYADDSFRLMLL